MKYTQTVTIEVNGKSIQATVTLLAPGLNTEDCLSAQMILGAVANNQDTQYYSRHHSDRVAKVLVRSPQAVTSHCEERPALRLVA